LSIDVRIWHREGWLQSGQTLTWSWTRGGQLLGSIDVVPIGTTAVALLEERRSLRQSVAIVWTKCHLGGRRRWFRCPCCSGRVAKLYCPGSFFACRKCCGLAYASQSEIPRHRAISQAQKLRMRLGGTANLLEPFPPRPRGMHRLTYHRLLARAVLAQELSIALAFDHINRHRPVV